MKKSVTILSTTFCCLSASLSASPDTAPLRPWAFCPPSTFLPVRQPLSHLITPRHLLNPKGDTCSSNTRSPLSPPPPPPCIKSLVLGLGSLPKTIGGAYLLHAHLCSICTPHTLAVCSVANTAQHSHSTAQHSTATAQPSHSKHNTSKHNTSTAQHKHKHSSVLADLQASLRHGHGEHSDGDGKEGPPGCQVGPVQPAVHTPNSPLLCPHQHPCILAGPTLWLHTCTVNVVAITLPSIEMFM